MDSMGVGLIGLGLLGSAIAERLIAAGYSTVGWDIDQVRGQRFAAMGGVVADSARDAATRFPRILLSLPDSHAVQEVLNDIQTGLRPGALILDTTTGSPAKSAALGEALAREGVGYMDATVAGSSEEARRGNVLVMVGGEKVNYERCLDLWGAFARRSYFVGTWGMGARMKLVVNLVLGLNRAVLAEGLCFASRQGLDPETALSILTDGPAFSRVMENKAKKMLDHEFSPQARLAQHWKDVRLILDAGQSVGAKTPLSRLHETLLAELVERGYGAEDNAAIVRAFEDGK